MNGALVLITGGTRGIGKAAAARLHRAGARVIVTSRGQAQMPEADFSAGPVCAPLDVRDDESVAALFDWIDAIGPLGVLINNAGVGAFKPLLETEPGELREIFDTNAAGLFRCARAAATRMRDAGGGRIVNIGSISDHLTLPDNGAYAASKFAVRALSHIMNAEWHPLGVRVTLLSLGAVATEIWDGREGPFDPADMLPVEEVAETLHFIASRPLSMRLDELRLVPPKGVL